MEWSVTVLNKVRTKECVLKQYLHIFDGVQYPFGEQFLLWRDLFRAALPGRTLQTRTRGAPPSATRHREGAQAAEATGEAWASGKARCAARGWAMAVLAWFHAWSASSIVSRKTFFVSIAPATKGNPRDNTPLLSRTSVYLFILPECLRNSLLRFWSMLNWSDSNAPPQITSRVSTQSTHNYIEVAWIVWSSFLGVFCAVLLNSGIRKTTQALVYSFPEAYNMMLSCPDADNRHLELTFGSMCARVARKPNPTQFVWPGVTGRTVGVH